MTAVIERHAVTRRGVPGAPPIVFAHGFGCAQDTWRHVAPAFESDHEIVLFDHIGSGQSDLSAYDLVRHRSLQGFAEDVVALLDDLALGPVVFVGHSVSSMIGALAAADRPDLFAHLVMVGPSPRYIDDEDYRGGFSQEAIDDLLATMDANYLGWSQHIAPVIMGVPQEPALGDELAASFCRTDPTIARRFARTTFLSDNRSDLARVSTPTLVLQCREDVIAPTEVGDYVADQLPDSQLVLLDAVGHCPQLSAPDEVIRALRELLTA